jgi:hypothetical protein
MPDLYLGEPTDLPLEAIGLGRPTQISLFVLSSLPFVGFVIGLNYAARKNSATRQLGRRIIYYTLALHVFFTVCVCPGLLYLTLR